MAIRGRLCRPVDTRRSSSQLKGPGSADRPLHQLARVLIFSDSSTVHCTLFAIIVTSALCAICLRSSVSDFGSNSTQIVPSCSTLREFFLSGNRKEDRLARQLEVGTNPAFCRADNPSAQRRQPWLWVVSLTNRRALAALGGSWLLSLKRYPYPEITGKPVCTAYAVDRKNVTKGIP